MPAMPFGGAMPYGGRRRRRRVKMPTMGGRRRRSMIPPALKAVLTRSIRRGRRGKRGGALTSFY